MGRSPRHDDADAWYHVMNRGAGRMAMFERPGDVDRFVARMAKVVEDEELEVHSFVVMGNHFHLLVRSPRRELARALQRIQGPYAQYFNRTRERDGPLHRTRYHAIRVRSYEYRCLLVGYIDWNPVCAGLSKTPEAYPHGSAAHYRRAEGPAWLTRTWVEEEVCRRAQIRRYSPGSYASTLGRSPSPGQERLLARRMSSSSSPEVDELDDLLQATPDQVRRWMLARRRRPNAKRWTALADEDSIADVLSGASGSGLMVPGISPQESREVLLIGLLRELCASSVMEAAGRTGLSTASVVRREAVHARMLASDAEYSVEIARLAVAALARCHAEP